MKLNWRSWSFHWHGTNKQGVHRWTGSIKPLRWIEIAFTTYGPIAGLTGVGAILYCLVTWHFAGAPLSLATVGLTHGLVFTSVGLAARHMRRHVSRLAPADQVGASLGLDEKALVRLAEQRNIRPRIILNEEPYYDPTDFVDALSLLRGSSAQSTAPDLLLRPAQSVGETTCPTSLLRATDSDQAKVWTGQASNDEHNHTGAAVQKLGQ